MFTIKVDKKDVLNDFPDVLEKWLGIIENNFNKKIREDNIEFYYSYGLYIPNVEDKEKFYEDNFETNSRTIYEDRLEYELSKVKINLEIKIDDFFISDRMESDKIPEIVKSIITELTKVKMLVEYEYHRNKDIRDTIPEINKDIVKFDIISDDYMNEDFYDYFQDYFEGYNDMEDFDFDLDSILDKISKSGLDSLSDLERDFLNKKSKDI